MVSEPRCETCRFWSRHPLTETPSGLCQRHPPQIVVITEAVKKDGVRRQWTDAEWPETSGSSWCGDHQLRADLMPKTVTEVMDMIFPSAKAEQ